jgi:hypothetical protein
LGRIFFNLSQSDGFCSLLFIAIPAKVKISPFSHLTGQNPSYTDSCHQVRWSCEKTNFLWSLDEIVTRAPMSSAQTGMDASPYCHISLTGEYPLTFHRQSFIKLIQLTFLGESYGQIQPRGGTESGNRLLGTPSQTGG